MISSSIISQESTKIIIIILTFAVLGYITFLLYKDNLSIKQELVKMRQEISELSEAYEDEEEIVNNLFCPQSESDGESDIVPKIVEIDTDADNAIIFKKIDDELPIVKKKCEFILKNGKNCSLSSFEDFDFCKKHIPKTNPE